MLISIKDSIANTFEFVYVIIIQKNKKNFTMYFVAKIVQMSYELQFVYFIKDILFLQSWNMKFIDNAKLTWTLIL